MLKRYLAAHPDEASCVARVRTLIESRTSCFERSCLPGHITASAWILSPDRRHFLLTHHKKLGRWLQLGGHADGDPNVFRVALREAQEESGMTRFGAVSPAWAGSGPEALGLPIDVDVHVIPSRPGEPEHEHHDVRFLLVAEPDQPLRISDESNDLAWHALHRLAEIAGDESVLRLASKAHARLSEPVIPAGIVADWMQEADVTERKFIAPPANSQPRAANSNSKKL